MPNRIIKESTFTSDRIASLSDFEFRLWVGLIVNADDAGRGDARPAIIKGHVFALRERVTVKDIDAALRTLAAAGCVSLYTVGGKPYYAFPSWAKHQRIRDCKPKFPGIDESDNLPQSAADCRNPPQTAALIQSESNPNPNPNPTREGAEFELFWDAYPKKVGKKDAKRAFGKVNEDVHVLIDAVNRQKLSTQWCKDGGQYIPNPSTWLNQERWNDELDANMGRKVPCGASGNLGAAELEAIQRVLREEDM